MSTLQDTRQPRGRITRLRTPRLAVSALIAIAATAVILTATLASHPTTTEPAAPSAQPRSHPPASVKSAAPAGAFLDPTSHAFPAAQIPDAITNPRGYFRDPATHAVIPVRPTQSTAQPTRSSAPTLASVLRSLTPAEQRYVRGILALTPGQLRAAFGTGH